MMANFSVSPQPTLQELLPNMLLGEYSKNTPIIEGLDCDSRAIQNGDLFFAYPGLHQDGREFIAQAVQQGAAAVCYENKNADQFSVLQDLKNEKQISFVPMDNLAQNVSSISARYFQEPAEKMHCLGVTGTNGKTTCVYWLTQLLQALGEKAGSIGTLGYGLWDENKKLQTTEHTTPDALHLQRMLYELQQQGAKYGVMEVSSHGLEQGRTHAVPFSSALLTNLSRDHLDYHGTMEAYGAAKAKLFGGQKLKQAVINCDDSFGRDLIETIRQQKNSPKVFSYSVSDSSADVYLNELKFNQQGVTANITSPWGCGILSAPVIGEFNVENLLGVIAILCAEGFDLPAVLGAAKTLQAVPGRLQPASLPAPLKDEQDITVLVDFAHTPDALEKTLQALQKQAAKKLWCVLGCGGDRDEGKRPLMGKMATRYADRVVVTSDNPRNEHPQKIIEQIMPGIVSGESKEGVEIVEDRAEAIAYAIAQAKAGDVILIAGKGHEAYQEIKGERFCFDDLKQAEQALRVRVESKGVKRVSL